MPELSIIIPNYNNAQYLPDCLDSIFKQTYDDFEVIICDDASTDNSLEVIDAYRSKHSNISVVSHKLNIGVAENRHSGIISASTKYFTVLDADDIYYDSRKLEKEMDLVKYYEGKGITICAFSNIAILDRDLNYLHDQWPVELIVEGRIFNEVFSRSHHIPRDYITTREEYLEVGKYDKNCSPYEDWDLKIRLSHKLEFYYTGIYGTGYRRDGVGLSYIPLNHHIRILKKVFKKNRKLIGRKDLVDIERNFQGHISKLKIRFLGNFKDKIEACRENKQITKVFKHNMELLYYKMIL